ncbi:very short patch repair endonuclease [Paramuribaculum intestinale]|jgi:DNA mismatch endonuclease (patch repair protein)|uniref:Very short patch repair endonuclease n=2 Tax=Paramuribaculum intestinale TaxID=2094151 RepID=A0A2V1IYY6_9BACT|nr:very short patch repair endonuclease [Paramuribaculum intestinale]MBJ2185922.1 DNA mismatch endonuclease Vsr [Muribaculaceae bacterium]ROS93317.1 DNA mismatch endonuclease Vsr [Muribaculaceae bacterium Isolate-043 (Harlan)]MCX4330498.1 very short patch repair endonuclease [Paramuribaculum intestinale]PWB07729.1 DNA mismatch endonuclease Vsr [Paramuribaculum intestinale]PWB12344.1 DNA mismatch endonuclease Vsr [Paramuribaculum intestinale]
MDVFSKEKRSQVMSSIRSTDTKPEMIVRKYLHANGFRYGLHNQKLPGHPDIVLRKYQTIVFINGCFWHGHKGCRHYTVPKSNTSYWTAKVRRNVERDAENITKLKSKGWRVITIWECELKSDIRENTLANLVRMLHQKAVEYDTTAPHTIMAAENAAIYGSDD